MQLRIQPFAVDHVEGAAELLARRHRTHREAEPLLAPAFEATGSCRQEIESVLAHPDASGAVATVAGRMVGYLLGSPKASSTWGPNVWVESAGHAVTDPEVIRDLYAVAAQRWVDEGRTAHFAMVPAQDRELVDAWSRLAFGQQHAHGVQAAVALNRQVPAGVTIRGPVRGDIPALAEIDVALPNHQAKAPVFSAGHVDTLEERLESWEKDIDDPAFQTFVAEVEDQVVGSAVGCALTMSGSNAGLIAPDHAGFLGFAAVLPAARGLGVGRALGEAVLDWSAATGYTSTVTDWRMTNLLSSRTWPRLGFRPHFLRMHRVVGY